MTKEKKPTKLKPRVHSELSGFEISIDSFGELKSNMAIEKLNEFLNNNVEDKKLIARDEATKKSRKSKTKK